MIDCPLELVNWLWYFSAGGTGFLLGWIGGYLYKKKRGRAPAMEPRLNNN